MALFDISVCRVYEKDATKVDRSTVLGNPFVMHSESERDRVCDEYQLYFDDLVKRKDPQLMNALRSLFITGKTTRVFETGLSLLTKTMPC